MNDTLPIGDVEQTTEDLDWLIRNLHTFKQVDLWVPDFLLYVRVTKKEAAEFLATLKKRTHAPPLNRVVGRYTISDNVLYLSHKNWNGAA